MPTDLALLLMHDHRVAAGRRNPRELQSRRATADHQNLLGLCNADQGPGTPGALAADLGVVDALHALARRGVAPAVIGGDATADVLLAALLRLVRPLRIGEQLPRQADGVAVAGLQQFLGVSRPGDAADQQHWLRRYAADVAGIT